MGTKMQTQDDSAIKLRVPQDFKSEVEAVAADMQISISDLARLALAEFIQSHKTEDGIASGDKEAA